MIIIPTTWNIWISYTAETKQYDITLNQALGKLHTAHCLGPPSRMGTWCTDPRLDKQLQAALMPTLPGQK